MIWVLKKFATISVRGGREQEGATTWPTVDLAVPGSMPGGSARFLTLAESSPRGERPPLNKRWTARLEADGMGKFFVSCRYQS